MKQLQAVRQQLSERGFPRPNEIIGELVPERAQDLVAVPGVGQRHENEWRSRRPGPGVVEEGKAVGQEGDVVGPADGDGSGLPDRKGTGRCARPGRWIVRSGSVAELVSIP